MSIFLDQTQCGKFSSIWVKIKLLLHSIIFYEKYIFHVALVYFDENATLEIMGALRILTIRVPEIYGELRP